MFMINVREVGATMNEILLRILKGFCFCLGVLIVVSAFISTIYLIVYLGPSLSEPLINFVHINWKIMGWVVIGIFMLVMFYATGGD